MSERIHIVVTGLGAVAPVGNDVTTVFENLKAGRSGIARISSFDPSPLATQIAGEVKGFDPRAHFDVKEARRLERFVQFAVVAAREAIADAHLEINAGNNEMIAVVIGSGIGGALSSAEQVKILETKGPRRVSPFFIPMMLVDTAAGQVAIEFEIKGPNMAVVSACATGVNAIGEAAEMIRRGDVDVVVCGGSEACLQPVAFAGFNVMGVLSTHNAEPEKAARPFDATRDGFVMGEGAGILVLESAEHARARGARIYGEVIGYGTSADANHVAAPDAEGEGIGRAMQWALKRARIALDEVHYINAHGTGTRLNDSIETNAIKQVFGENAYNIPISSTKSMIGHTLGAAGALEAIFCLKAMQEQILPPTINYTTPDPVCDLDYVPNVARPHKINVAMSNSIGLGGHNASIIFQKS
ncbi:MAG: beta-ketoacyl-[acyl-carrier-protein] synthase II [Chloroflexi bacterium RBG_16_56_8]|nr:MAG: beta-ketoacyl-[acyl-carrier-protein] synthase II [Chloroflexi bacterium RBG_16_56_8]